MSQPQVLIVGAGPTGLVLALWLKKLGVRFRIIDKTAEAGTTSRAMGVHARTLEFYRQMGIADEAIARGVKVAGINLWGRGRKAMRLRFGNIGAGLSPFPFMLDFPQDQHEAFLIEKLAAMGTKVERRTELLGFEEQPGGIRATLKRPDNSEEICQVAYLAGCDGARSAVRTGLDVGFPGGTFDGLFYVADVEASGPSIDHEIHVDVDDGDFVAIFPFKDDKRVRLIGAVRQKPGSEPRELTFDDIRGTAIEHMRITVNKMNWFSTYHVHHRVADHFRKGRAFLLGDAAHIHSPVGAQGMNTGIGDAINLSWKLAAVLNDGAADALLDTYESERIGFARRLVASTDRIFTLVARPGSISQFIRLQVVPRVMPRLLRLPPVRRLFFRTLSQIGIKYRTSPLSTGAAGGVHGGDRLPWVSLDDGDNFTPLTSLKWQVHVYGEPRRELPETCARLRIPIHFFTWSPGAKQSGLVRGALYLIRPDGYIALADAGGDPNSLLRYFADHGDRLGSRT
ncbi:MAG: FAD-dependent monooxygenase [Planctomycetes bacterium]|nr:FAD-dependent monooxygenase [Planctomycetota bacterium]